MRFHGYPLPDATKGAGDYERANNLDLAKLTPLELVVERNALGFALTSHKRALGKSARPAPTVCVGARRVDAPTWAASRVREIEKGLSRGRA